MNTKKTCVIVGGGFGGLASAILMAQDGYAVTLLEKNEQLGGRASLLQKGGFTRDMGPSWYLMPDIFQNFFDHIGEKIEDHLSLQQLTPQYRIYFEEDINLDGPQYIDITGDLAQDMKTIESIEPGVGKNFIDYLQKSEQQYDTAIQYIYKNYDTIFDFFSRELASSALKLKVFSVFEKYVQRFFATSKMQKIVQYPLVFLGTAPYHAPALYNIMSHVDFNLGLFYPQGGIYQIVRALKNIGETYGVVYHTGQAVKSFDINEKTGSISKVHTQTKTYEADCVICNADMAWTETTLLPKQWQTYDRKYWEKKVFAPSAFIIYLGLNTKIPNILHHTLLFAHDWKKNFGAIFGDEKYLPENPSLYLCTPSKTDPNVAPEGQENMFILVPIPNGISISQEQENAYEKAIIEYIENTCHISIQEHIVQKERFHVKDFAQRYNAWNGTALGLAHKLSQTALRRPNNISKKIKNLFYVGHNTNPGIGMPMVLVSALLVQKRVAKAQQKNFF